MIFFNNKLLKIMFSLVLLFALASCSTADTIGAINAGLGLASISNSFGIGKMKEGHIYKDPKNRFQVICPTEAKISKSKQGITFTDALMPGLSYWTIDAYEIPAGNSLTLENLSKGIKSNFIDKGIDIEIIREESINYRGYEALNFDFIFDSNNKNLQRRPYVTRLIITNNFGYWLRYSNLSSGFFSDGNSTNQVIIKDEDLKDAEKFFDSVKVEKEF